MRFKLDENLPVDLRDELVSQGHDAQTCADEKLTGAADPVVFGAVVAESRILLTCDLDFSDIRLYPPGRHAGIVVFRTRRTDSDSCLAAVARLLFAVPESDMHGNLIVVEEQRIRIRRPSSP